MPDPAPIQELEEGFARVRAAVDAGETDLSRLGFWRLLATVKADPVLANHWADVAGDIDRRAFERYAKLRFPLAVGNALLVGATIAGGVAIGLGWSTSSDILSGLAFVAAGAIWSVSVHSLTHWVVGRAVGIRFTSYFVGGPFPPRPGVKTDYATYLRASPSARAWMHASGAIATKLAPFVALAFWWGSDAPSWSAVALLALGVLQIVTDVLFSVRSSDWKKVRRELAIARRQAHSSA